MQDIANRSDSIDIAKVYCDIALINKSWMGSLSSNKKQDDFFSVLHSLESDTNCSRSTKDVSKLVKNFLDKPLKKNKETVTTNSVVVCLPLHDGFVSGIFKHPDFF